MTPRIFSSRQVGKLVGADPSSVNRWIDSGKLKAYRTPGGHRRVLYDDLLDFLEGCGMPTPAELMPDNKSLLIVDDDKGYLRTLRRALLRADRSLQVDTCDSGVEALIRIGANRPDVVILDVHMPGVDGNEVCQKIKTNPDTANTTVIAVAGRSSTSTERKMREAGASAFVVKPIKTATLLEMIRPSRSGRRTRR